VYGGFDGIKTYFAIAIFDPVQLTWTYPETQGIKPIERTNHSAAVAGKKIYIYGGNYTPSTEESYTILGDMQCFDTETLTWRQIKSPGSPGPRTAHCMTAVGTKIFLFGGGMWEPKPMNRWIKKFNDVYLFDTETDVWSQVVPRGEIPICSFPLAFTIENWIFFFGGQKISESYISDELHCFDTVSLSCHNISSLIGGKVPKPRDLGTASLVEGRKIYMFAGSSGNPVNDLNLLVWGNASQSLPMPTFVSV